MNDGVNLLDRYIGSPIYGMAPEHGAALLLVLMVGIGALLVRLLANRGHTRSEALVLRYRSLPSTQRLLAWLLAISAASNLGMALGRMASPVSLWLIIVAGAQLVVGSRGSELACSGLFGSHRCADGQSRALSRRLHR